MDGSQRLDVLAELAAASTFANGSRRINNSNNSESSTFGHDHSGLPLGGVAHPVFGSVSSTSNGGLPQSLATSSLGEFVAHPTNRGGSTRNLSRRNLPLHNSNDSSRFSSSMATASSTHSLGGIANTPGVGSISSQFAAAAPTRPLIFAAPTRPLILDPSTSAAWPSSSSSSFSAASSSSSLNAASAAGLSNSSSNASASVDGGAPHQASNLVVCDGSTITNNNSSNNQNNQNNRTVTPPPPSKKSKKSKAPSISTPANSKKTTVEGPEFGEPPPKFLQCIHCGRFPNAKDKIVVHFQVHEQLQDVNSERWDQPALSKESFKTLNGHNKKTKKPMWKKTNRCFPHCILKEFTALFDRLIFISLWTQWTDEEKNEFWDDCKKRHDKPTISCMPKAVRSGAAGAALAAGRGLTTNAVGSLEEPNNKKRHFEESQSADTLQAQRASKKHRKKDVAATANAGVDDRTSRRGPSSPQNKLRDCINRTDSSPVEEDGTETKLLPAVVKTKRANVIKMGNNHTSCELDTKLSLFGRDDNEISSVLGVLSNVKITDDSSDADSIATGTGNTTSTPVWTNSDEDVDATVWTACSKRPPPFEVEEKENSNRPRIEMVPTATLAPAVAAAQTAAAMHTAPFPALAAARSSRTSHSFGSNVSGRGWIKPTN